VQLQAFPVFGQPAVQHRPLPDQRLMRQLNLILPQRDQAGGGQGLEHRFDQMPAFYVGCQLVACHTATALLNAVAKRNQPQEDAPRHGSLFVAETIVDGVRSAGDRATDTPGRRIPFQRQHPARPGAPGLKQRVRQKRQRAGLASHIAHQQVNQPWLHLPPSHLERSLDAESQLRCVHLANVVLRGLERAAKAGKGRTMAIEVRAQRDNQCKQSGARLAIPHRCSHQVRDKCGALGLVLAEREDLFELVNDEKRTRGCPNAVDPGLTAGKVERQAAGISPHVVNQRCCRQDRAGGRQCQRQRLQRMARRS